MEDVDREYYQGLVAELRAEITRLRERIRNSQKTIFRLRLRDAWTGSIVFS